MNILKKLTIKNLKLNIKRTIGTTIGIILSVALICAVGCLFTCFQKTLINQAVNGTGYYHISFEYLSPEKYEEISTHKNVQNVYTMYRLGVSRFKNTDPDSHPYVKVFSVDKNSFDDLKFNIREGRFPNNATEILVSPRFLSDTELSIGDTIELDVGERYTKDGYELFDYNPYNEEVEEYIKEPVHKTYKIVGVSEKNNWNNSYYVLTTKESTNNIRAWLALKSPGDYKKTALELLGYKSIYDMDGITNKDKYFYSTNRELLRWEVFAFSDSTFTFLLGICVVVIAIIMITSIFCIRNSFAISTLEKMRMYGMLSSVGATKKQIKKSVLLEGLILGLIGIPIGLLGGVFAVYILVIIINALTGDNGLGNGLQVAFNINIVPFLIAIVLGFTVIYFSSLSSARRASKVSPIENLRNTSDIKISSKKLHTPRIISGLFKTGGTLAYKNLKRSKKKYRTTVISLAVSVFVFISMNAFINETFVASSDYYTDYKFNVLIEASKDELENSTLNEIKKIDPESKVRIMYEIPASLNLKNTNNVNMYNDEGILRYGISIYPVALDDATFKEYAKSINANYEEIKDKAILYNLYRYYSEDGKTTYEVPRYSYKKGDVVEGTVDDVEKSYVLGAVTMEPPIGLEHHYYSGGYIIFNAKYTDLDMYPNMIMIDTKNAEKVVSEIKKIDSHLNPYNIEEQVRSEKAMILIVSIFLYGFITVITLIGVTNIFNTITANMELRSREFAILKCVGMTKKEFNRMINLETLFYSSKSLIFGIILGIGGSYIIHIAFSEGIVRTFTLPINAILISIIFVFIIVYIIMKYSISKINKQNIIETIRKENI